MKYTKEERLDIGRRIYEGELSRYQAADVYGISDETARNYMRLYRDANQLPAKRAAKSSIKAPSFRTDPANMEELEEASVRSIRQNEELCQQYPAVSGIPSAFSASRLPLAERQDPPGYRACSF